MTSCWIFPTMEAALPAINSASMPKRCLILLSTSFLSSALAGTETTTFPSFLAASTILFHSFCAGCPVCARPTLTFQNRAEDENEKNEQFHVLTQRVLYSPKSFRATTAPGSLTL